MFSKETIIFEDYNLLFTMLYTIMMTTLIVRIYLVIYSWFFNPVGRMCASNQFEADNTVHSTTDYYKKEKINKKYKTKKENKKDKNKKRYKKNIKKENKN